MWSKFEVSSISFVKSSLANRLRLANNKFDIESAIESFNSFEHEIKNYNNYLITILYNSQDTVNSKAINQFLTYHKLS